MPLSNLVMAYIWLLFALAMQTRDDVCVDAIQIRNQNAVCTVTCFVHRDEIDNPLGVVQKLFRSSTNPKTASKDWGVRAHFENFLRNHWDEVQNILNDL